MKCIICERVIPKRMRGSGKQKKYCSMRCKRQRDADQRRIKAAKLKPLCVVCKKKPIAYRRRKYCSHECSYVMILERNIPKTTSERLIDRIRKQVRRNLVTHVKGDIPYGAMRLLPYTPVELVNHLARDWPNGFPEDIENYDIDHIIPLNHYKQEGELESVENIVKAFALGNLRLITQHENRAKRAKVIECGV